MRFLHRGLFALMVVLAVPGAAVAELLPRSVLILDATEPNSPWGIEFRAVLRSALSADAKGSIAIYSEVLDLARFNTKEYEEVLLTYIRAKYRDKPIGVIVVHGAQALDIFMRLRADVWPTVPVVFASVDEATVARLKLPPDVTGTILQLRLGNMVTAARALVPSLKHIALVGDPFDRQPFRKHFTQELSQLPKELKIIDLMDLPIGELKERVAALPPDSAIIYVPLYVDRAGAIYISRDVLGQVAEAANRPVVSDVATHIGYGSTGGLMGVPTPVGQVTARLALRVLNGEKAADIPITVGDFTKPIFDWRQLQRFAISENSLPVGSEIRFRQYSMWEQYRTQVITVCLILLLQGMLISYLLYQRQRRLRAESELRHRLAEVIHLNRTATAGALSASIAHELNQPLGAILSNAEAAEMLLTAMPPDLEQIKEIIADIRRDDQRAGDVIRHLRGLLKKSDVVFQIFDLNDVIHGALDILGPEAKKRGVSLTANQAEHSSLVRADRVHLQQVLLNVAINAMDAMQANLPRARELTIQTSLVAQSEVEVSIADSGVGIPNEMLKSIFDTFMTTKQQGTGLGLSIARTIIETYGGNIWAENRAAGGAIIRFRLPLAPAPST